MRRLVQFALAGMLVVTPAGLASAPVALAHPGRTAGDGCHYCRTNCASWGEVQGARHCHGGGYADDDLSDSGGGGAAAPPPPPPKPKDTTPPERPEIVETSIEKTTIRVVLTAEKSSRVRVERAGVVLTTVTASGREQPVSFSAPEGRHQLSITATDAAGNTSPATMLTVDIDATPPQSPKIETSKATPQAPRTVFAATGEPQSVLELVVTAADGAEAERRTVKLDARGKGSEAILLANGMYELAATLTDKATNRSDPRLSTLEVAVAPPPRPTVELVSQPGRSPVLLKITSVPFGQGVVQLVQPSGVVVEEAFNLFARGTKDVRLEVQEGSYLARVELVDYQSQLAPTAHLAGIRVKQTKPALQATLAEDDLNQGQVAYRIETDPGTTVSVRLDDGEPNQFQGTGKALTGTISASSGQHTLFIEVVDRFGNRSVQELVASVTTPLRPFEVVLVLGVLGAIGYVLVKVRSAIGGFMRRLRPAPAVGMAAETPAVFSARPGLIARIRQRAQAKWGKQR